MQSLIQYCGVLIDIFHQRVKFLLSQEAVFKIASLIFDILVAEIVFIRQFGINRLNQVVIRQKFSEIYTLSLHDALPILVVIALCVKSAASFGLV